MDTLAAGSIMRTWTGWIPTDQRDAYRLYLEDTGMSDYLRTPGNIGAWVAYRDLDDGRTEVTTVSIWKSHDAVRAFAGDDIDRARFYPEDDRFLIDRELTVKHYEVA